MEKLLGTTLTGAQGAEKSTSDALSGKEVVGLYFSAHWCPPCRGFTPKLAEAYKGLVAGNKPIEIVFVSSDRDEAAFSEYFGEQPWLALPFSARDKKNELSKKYKVSGIPTLVLLNGATGELITKDGRAAIMEDPQGENFPWTPPTLNELWESLGESFLGQGGAAVPRSSLEGKKLALYFSAHWCPPCRGFTPTLVSTYEAMKTAGRLADAEFIFVSSDRDEAAFGEYFGEMPWLALPFEKRKEKEALSKFFGVAGIPSLVTLEWSGGELQIVNKSARGPAAADAEGAEFPWAPKPLEDLTAGVEANGFDVNEKPALVALYDGVSDAAVTKAIAAAMTEVAAEHAAAGKASESGEPEVIFFTAASANGPVGQVKSLCGLPSTATEEPTLLLLDIPDDGGFYTRVGGITAEAIKTFLADYKDKKLDRKQLQK